MDLRARRLWPEAVESDKQPPWWCDGQQGSTAATKYAIGPMGGYNFGPVIVQAYYHQNLMTKNYVGGDEFWTRVLIPF